MSTNFKTILVTGASRGIGLEIVEQLLESNSDRIVYATSRSFSDNLTKLQEKYTSKRLIIEELSVDNDKSIDKLVQKLKHENVKIDVLLNNAGVGRYDTVLNASRQDVLSIFDTNTLSPLIISQKFYNNQLFNSNGLVANISSIIGSIDNAHQFSVVASYAISKASLNMITKLQSVSFAEGRVRSLSIHPGWLKTEMGGENAPLNVDVGVAGVVKVIENFTDEQNGTFIQFDGTPLNW